MGKDEDGEGEWEGRGTEAKVVMSWLARMLSLRGLSISMASVQSPVSGVRYAVGTHIRVQRCISTAPGIVQRGDCHAGSSPPHRARFLDCKQKART